MTATVSEEASLGMHDLVVTASGGVADTVAHSVCVRSSIDDAFYVVHVTDTHLPTHNFSSDGVAGLADSSEMVDFREVIRDINTINPDFVIMTGDLVNEGELEDYLGERVFTRAFRLLKSLDVPVYVVPGNHDIGGWPTTPPADGTSRHDWWRFFGWRYLNDPPAGMPLHTQNYSFDYGGIHFVGLEAYDNYDYWRPEIYGPYSFTDDQMAWLQDDLDAAGAATPTVLFYHYDFGDDINLSALGVECALWGHIHVSSGSITQAPYNLATGSVCDGRRLMRLVRFDDGAVIPSSTISSGSQGLLLNTAYEPANDGSSSTITATVTNGTAERFEHAAVRFRVPSADAPYTIDVGTLVQTLVEDDVAECLVTLDVPAHGDAVVTISPDTTSGPVPDVPTLYQSDPNPARTGASISFSLASAGHVTLRVYDVAGRLVATPFSGDAAAGPNNVRWDLRGSGGSRVASGIYFYRLTGDGFEITRKLVVVR